ncbi:cytochrome P450 [Parathielavia appendiculata]|uniref:Cytochrome P450 n=1 Tax=Parathielavia appendiculata TaxID=2587402 RepID=A0AAN6U9H7_9PEZI|nr:cytochrome P450 [Parathielavia appendiculata]
MAPRIIDPPKDSSRTKVNTPFPVFALSVAVSFCYARKYGHPTCQTVPLWVVTGILIYWAFWRSWIFPRYFSELRHIPTVRGFPLWGQFIPIVTEECGVPQRKWHRKYGGIIRYCFPLGTERLSIADNRGIKHVTSKNPYNFPKPLRAKLWMTRILGNGVLLAEGHEHAYQRKTVNPGFSIRAIHSFVPIFWQKGLRMVDLQEREVIWNNASERTIEVLEWFNRATLDIIGKAGFGYDIGSLEDETLPLREAYRLCFNFDFESRLLHGVQAFFPKTQYLPSKMNDDINKARAIIINKATEILTERRSRSGVDPNAKDVLSLITQEDMALREKGEPGLSFETMRDQIMTFLGAGHDTTATGATWTIHLLSIHPDIQERVRNEIREYMPFLFDRSWTYDPDTMALPDPDQLPYLDKVCRESLRFIPPIPMTVRESVEDDCISGYHVPAKTVTYMLSNAINRMEWFWGEDADEFDPDRWDNLPKSAVPNAFMTFLQGPRGCIGRKFAEVEMKVLLCCFLSRWEFVRDDSTPDPEDWKMWRLVLRPKYGVTVKCKPVLETW